jgi:surface carbohydrate biosynthesis protein
MAIFLKIKVMKKCSKTILIPIETISRELDYKVYLAMLLSTKGFQVLVGKKQSIYRLFDKYSDYIYLDKGYHQDVSDVIYNKIKANNGIILNLDEEGAVDFPNNSTLLNRYSLKMLKVVDKVFLWGKSQKEMINTKHGELTNLLVTGHPRFLLLKNKFFGLYNDDVASLKNTYGDFILVNTNFGFGNNIKGDELVEKNYGSRFKNITKIISEDKLKLKAIIKLIDRLSNKNKIIVRPHPEENIETYYKIYNKNSNVKILRENSSIPWIMACSKCIHIDCTTGIEAAIIGKRVISYVPDNIDRELLTKLPLEVSEVFSSIQKVVTSISKNEKIKTNKHKALSNHFSINSDVENLVDEIILFKEKTNAYSFFLKNSLAELIYLLKNLLRKFYLLFYTNPLEKSKLKNYNLKNFKCKFDFYKSQIISFSKCELIKKGDIYVFKNYN